MKPVALGEPGLSVSSAPNVLHVIAEGQGRGRPARCSTRVTRPARASSRLARALWNSSARLPPMDLDG